jgi:hypothetical protein
MRFLMTQSLLAAWEYMFKSPPPHLDVDEIEFKEKAKERFLSVLKREPQGATEPMLKGREFEALVYEIAQGATVDERTPFYEGAKKIANIVAGGQYQVKVQKSVWIGKREFLLYGILDCLKSGAIYDVKFTSKRAYYVGKFFNSPQHPMYLELVPEARMFTYLISDGNMLWGETFARGGEMRGIIPRVKDFLYWLEFDGLLNLYLEKWEART